MVDQNDKKSRKIILYVEGGGDSDSLKTECRKGFRMFLEKAGCKGRMPRIVSCGGRVEAFNRFKSACAKIDVYPILLIDSEDIVAPQYMTGNTENWETWLYLFERKEDKWKQPDNATDEQCHFMSVCMESWLILDTAALKNCFQHDFKENAIKAIPINIENAAKDKIFDTIKKMTNDKYDKGRNSFKILSMIDPNKITDKALWAQRFIAKMKSL